MKKKQKTKGCFAPGVRFTRLGGAWARTGTSFCIGHFWGFNWKWLWEHSFIGPVCAMIRPAVWLNAARFRKCAGVRLCARGVLPGGHASGSRRAGGTCPDGAASLYRRPHLLQQHGYRCRRQEIPGRCRQVDKALAFSLLCVQYLVDADKRRGGSKIGQGAYACLAREALNSILTWLLLLF